MSGLFKCNLKQLHASQPSPVELTYIVTTKVFGVIAGFLSVFMVLFAGCKACLNRRTDRVATAEDIEREAEERAERLRRAMEADERRARVAMMQSGSLGHGSASKVRACLRSCTKPQAPCCPWLSMRGRIVF